MFNHFAAGHSNFCVCVFAFCIKLEFIKDYFQLWVDVHFMTEGLQENTTAPIFVAMKEQAMLCSSVTH